MKIPDSVDELTPAWVGQAMKRFGATIEPADIRVLERHQGTNANARISLRWLDGTDGPSTLFVKMAPPAEPHRGQVLGTGMGDREVRFYQTAAEATGLATLEPYVAEVSDETGAFVLLLEDLSAVPGAVPDGTTGVDVDLVDRALGDLAAMHVRYADRDTRRRDVPWLRPRRAQSSYGRAMLQTALENHRELLSEPFAEIAQLYVDHQQAVGELWSAGPQTVLHGDPHIGNVFLREGRLGFLDWGLMTLGTPLRDVSYLIVMCLDPTQRRAHERELITSYVRRRELLAADDIGVEAAWALHRLHAAYTVVASCQIVTFPSGQSAARDAFSQAFLARCVAAIDDLDAPGVLQRLLTTR